METAGNTVNEIAPWGRLVPWGRRCFIFPWQLV